MIQVCISEDTLKRIRTELVDTARVADSATIQSSADIQSTHDRVKNLVEKSKADAESLIHLEITVLLSNMGQVPVSISRFGILEIDESFLLPIERIDESTNILVTPEHSKEVVFATPTKEESDVFWATLMQHRNQGSSVRCRLLVQSDGELIESTVARFADVSEERKHVSEKLLRRNEQLPLDVSELD